MKSISFDRFGEPAEVLRLTDAVRPELQSDEVLVRMTARPVNPSDLMVVRGAFRHRTLLPMVPGFEGVGVVEAVGQNVTDIQVGDRVLPLRGDGTWQEYVSTKSDFCIPVPPTIHDEAASQLYVNPVTARIILTAILRLNAGEWIIINAAGSAFAHVFIQLSVRLGLNVIAVTRNAHHTDRLIGLGARIVIDTSIEPLSSALGDLNHIEISAALDAIGGNKGGELACSVRPGGTIVNYGILSGLQMAITDSELARRGVTRRWFWLREWTHSVTLNEWKAAFEPIIEAVADYRLSLPDVRSFPLHCIREAVLESERQASSGKVILTS